MEYGRLGESNCFSFRSTKISYGPNGINIIPAFQNFNQLIFQSTSARFPFDRNIVCNEKVGNV